MSNPINYTRIASLMDSTLARYLGRPGSDDGFGMLMEFLTKRIVLGKLMGRLKMDWKGGTTIKFPVQFTRSNVGGFSGPYAKLALKTTRGPSYGSVPIRVYGWAWFKSFLEIELNKGEHEMVRDLVRDAKSAVAADTIMAQEEAFLARDGNYLHDGEGADFLFPFGLRYNYTIDGLHITGDTTKSVYGINPYTYPLWRHPFINPVTSSDQGVDGRISSVYQLPIALERMMQQLSFDSPQTWGKVASDLDSKSYEPTDYDRAAEPEDLFIMLDTRSSIDFRSVLFDRRDDVGREQAMGRPTWKGMDVMETDRLGMNSYGYGYDDDGTALWTDRTESYASGQWANYGECVVLNRKHYHVVAHPDHFPKVYPSYKPEGMEGLASEGSLWWNTLCTSRQRCGGYIGPFNRANTN